MRVAMSGKWHRGNGKKQHGQGDKGGKPSVAYGMKECTTVMGRRNKWLIPCTRPK